MSVLTHELGMAINPLGDRFAAWCSCGWEGEEQELREWAVEEWENHCDVAFMKATERG